MKMSRLEMQMEVMRMVLVELMSSTTHLEMVNRITLESHLDSNNSKGIMK
jgi:hypothetical protein